MIRSFAQLREAMALRDGAVDALVFADASHSLHSMAGGWGAWICTADVPGYTAGGPLAGPIASSTEAEMLALACAMDEARGVLKPGAAVLLHSDSQNALKWIIHGYERAKDWPASQGVSSQPIRRPSATCAASPGLARFRHVCDALELVVFTRHVRGHQSAGLSHAHDINRECDRLASRQRRAAEAHIRSTT